jgi:hypothetical protein
VQRSHQMAFYGLAFVLTYELAILFFDQRHLLKDGYDIAKAALNLQTWARIAALPCATRGGGKSGEPI